MSRVKRANYTFRFTQANPFNQGSFGTSYQETFQLEEAIVVDVVVNDQHPDYDTDGYNVGAVKVRMLSSDAFEQASNLTWAFPMSSNVTDYPLLNEIVLVMPALNRFYYTRRLNVSNRVTAQPLFGLNDGLKARPSTEQQTSEMSRVSDSGAPVRDDQQQESDRLGAYFEDKPTVYRLRSREGDIIYEGRTGQSIRLGSTPDVELSPTLLLRCGPNPNAQRSTDSPYSLIDEDINEDRSSIWMVANQTIPLTFATIRGQTHFKSATAPGTLDGNQIILNSDRIVLNTRADKLLVSTFLGTHFSTMQDHTVDTEKNYRSYAAVNREIEIGQKYLITVGADYLLKVGASKTSEVTGKTIERSNDTYAIVAPKIFIGSLDNEAQPLVRGEDLRAFLLEFIDAHLKNATSHTLPTIGIGPLSPAVVAALQTLRTKVAGSKKAPFESQTNFVV
jgi:hypothetical protein